MPLSQEPQTHKFLWWGLAIIETLLFGRFILGYFDANLTGALAAAINTVTSYILYPFTTTLTSASASGDGSSGWITIVAIGGYFVITIALVRFLKAKRSFRSRIERARTLSRRRYSR